MPKSCEAVTNFPFCKSRAILWRSLFTLNEAFGRYYYRLTTIMILSPLMIIMIMILTFAAVEDLTTSLAWVVISDLNDS